MDWIKTKYDRLLLGVFGVAAIVAAVMMILGNPSPGTLAPERGGPTDPGPVPAEDAKLAIDYLTKQVTIGGSDMFASQPYLQTSDGTKHKVRSPESLRSPIPNEWLDKFDLPITRRDVASLDSDGDKFTNAEEWQANTNPRSSQSKPPFTSKIYIKEIVVNEYTISFPVFEARTMEVQLRREKPAPRKLDFLKKGDDFPSDTKTFKVVKVEEKVVTVPGNNASEKRGVVTLLENNKPGAEPFEVIEKQPVERPTFQVVFEYTLTGKTWEPLKEGDSLSDVPGEPTVKLLVKSIKPEEQQAVIEYTPPGETKPVEVTIQKK